VTSDINHPRIPSRAGKAEPGFKLCQIASPARGRAGSSKATARGRFLELQQWARVAEESGSRVWARPREACHLTPSQWRARHTGATPHLASRVHPKQTSIATSKVPWL